MLSSISGQTEWFEGEGVLFATRATRFSIIHSGFT